MFSSSAKKGKAAAAKAALEKQLQESSSDDEDDDNDDDDDGNDPDLSQNLLSPSLPIGTVSTVARGFVESQLTVSTGLLGDKDEGEYNDVADATISEREGDGNGATIYSRDDELNNDEIQDYFAVNNDDDDDSFGGGFGNDYAAQDYDLFDRIWHWIDPVTIITDGNRRAIESCIVIEAGMSVEETATTEDTVLHERMRVAYTRLLRKIPPERFESEKVMNDTLLQLKGGQGVSFTGTSLWRQYAVIRKHVRNLSAEMPGATNFHSLPSGNSLRDAMKKLICKKYVKRKGAKKTYDEVTDAWEEIPSGWWLKHHSVVFLLSLMVHRQSPAIINQAADADPGAPREVQRAASAAVVARERRVESNQRHETNEASRKQRASVSADTALEETYKAARVEGMKGVAIKHRITAAEMKLRMMNENRAHYVAAAEDAVSGEAELNKKIKSVIDNLPDSFEDLTGHDKGDNVD